MPTAYVWYIISTAKEDRATLGSDPSALAVPYGMGRGPFWASSSIYAGGPKAINPSQKAS